MNLRVTILAAALAAASPAAQTPPRPAASVRLGELRVTAAITDGIATTELRQVVRNDAGAPAEAIWILPLPAGAVTDGFSMTVDGVAAESEVLDAERARSTYEAIVRRQRDPGLLEYLGAGCLRARIFPVPARGHAEVVVRYRQVLPETGGLHRWTFPLRAAHVDSLRPERIAVALEVRCSQRLNNVFSPLPAVDVVVHDDHHARASLELSGSQVPERDLSILYGASEDELGLSLLAYRKRDSSPGFFALMLSPRRGGPDDGELKKAVQLVVDTSGSMEGEKIRQARGALRYFVQWLRPGDWFNVVPFATEARPFFPRTVPATPENVQEALARIDEIAARGGTDIGDALGTALAAESPPTHVPITVLLTDGQPTVGTTDPARLLAVALESNRGRQRVFVFGVGHDVNTHLLDRLAETTRGDRDYVAEGEDIEVETSALFEKLSHPALTDVELCLDGVAARDLVPKRMPDLFRGGRLLVLGRYDGSGPVTIRLRGKVGERTEEHVYEAELPRRDTRHDFVPALWAERRVAVLLDAIRLHGQDRELLLEVRRLGTEFGIATPYTSHLIVDEADRLAKGTGRYRGPGDAHPGAAGSGPSVGGPSGPTTPGLAGPSTPAGRLGAREAARSRQRLLELGGQATGRQAVEDSRNLRTSGSDEFFLGGARRVEHQGVARLARRVADKTFYLVGETWIDAAFRPETPGTVAKIAAFSDAYFALLRDQPELAPYLAVGSRVLVVAGDRAIEITAPQGE